MKIYDQQGYTFAEKPIKTRPVIPAQKALLAILIFCGSLTAQAQLSISPAGSSGGLASTDIDTTTEINTLTTNDDFPTLTAENVFLRLALGVTPSSSIQLSNTTAAGSGAQQISPGIRLTGQGWKTTATAASQAVDARIYLVPIQGTTTPNMRVNFDYSLNGGAFASLMSITDTTLKQLQVPNILGTGLNADGSAGGNPYFYFTASGVFVASTNPIGFSSTASAAGTIDTRIRRNAANVVESHNGTISGDFLGRALRSNAVAFASAVSSPAEGTLQAFTDSSTATWGDTITGGGANHVLGYFNGTNWTVVAK